MGLGPIKLMGKLATHIHLCTTWIGACEKKLFISLLVNAVINNSLSNVFSLYKNNIYVALYRKIHRFPCILVYTKALCCSGILDFLNMTTRRLNVDLTHSLVTGLGLETTGITRRLRVKDHTIHGDWT